MNIGRLKWRSKRSMLELDLYFDSFIQENGLDKLSIDELNIYENLLEFEDNDLLLLFQGKEIMDDNSTQQLINKICKRV